MYGHRIAELRENNGWTQEELSEAIGISRASLSHYEKNRRKPNLETLTRLADKFHVSIDYIIGRRNPPQSKSVKKALELKD
ncbi:DNA-binding transcriptional regulator, XRE-family HTH domain [Paenibacillus uliginis N3/975]|uniref:DNA-binding transcriptional regulator, XRE-family HTH domain n=1 Tax=Paenibacillus uliginis N3/975 TaxID=1313296 RepID=A0A1X7GP82_9BACL|nr:DNA-binding transcriptional regulator, XRE-family HTH domain [Paenibacillus uliginis N3/975]